MTRREPVLVLWLCALAAVAGGCDSGPTEPPFQETLDIAVCAPAAGPFTLDVTNRFFPLAVGSQWVFDGQDEGDVIGLVITVLPDTEVVAGVATRVVEERETVNGDLIEISRNFFVQAPDGGVCYFGEDVDIYEGGVVVSHDGAWRAGVGGALPGIFMPPAPAVGMAFRQEVAPGVAEDRVQVQAVDESVTTPAGTFSATVRFVETTPLEPGVKSTKVFARDVGPIVDDVVRLTSRTP